MAPKKSRASAKVEKCQRSLLFEVPDGNSYIDIALALSAANRKLFRQGMVYGIESIDFFFVPSGTAVTQRLSAYVAPDTWMVHNAHVKGHALWNQMNDLVLEDNPSLEGKWSDFKVFLDQNHRTAVVGGGVGNLVPLDGNLGAYGVDEWEYSDYVMPQHTVDPATGLPLVADQTNVHLLGGNLGGPGAFASVGLVEAYALSRATVSPDQPFIPVGSIDGFFNLLTDSGSQEPELQTVIEAEGDNPPYNRTQYPGGALNGPAPVSAEFAVASVGQPNGLLTAFAAPCGLIQITNAAVDATGIGVPARTMIVRVNLMGGNYKGVAAIPMGQ